LVSDVHLMESDLATAQAWQHFIHTHAPHAEALYILGDLFEFWIGTDGASDFQQRVLTDLAKLHACGVSVYFMVGNRDFLWTKQLCQQLHIHWLDDPCLIERYDQRILLTHGDALCIHDKPYQRLRRIVRNPVIQFLFGCLPLTLRQRLADRARQGSQQHTQTQRAEYMDVDIPSVQQWLHKAQVNTLVHGHTHKPNTSTLGPTASLTRITLGDWRPEGVIARWDRTGIQLLTTPTLAPFTSVTHA
jgi:UDP-2,3-diacylglucosamine hydrolase